MAGGDVGESWHLVLMGSQPQKAAWWDGGDSVWADRDMRTSQCHPVRLSLLLASWSPQVGA